MSKAASIRIMQGKGLGYGKCGKITLPRLNVTLHYRSSYEKDILLLLDKCLDVSNISVESLRITYYDVNRKERYYIPDFLVTTYTNDTYIVEVKPKCFVNDNINKLKFIAAKKYAIQHNMMFLILTEEILLNKNSVTTTLVEVTRLATATALKLGLRYSLISRVI